MSTNMLTVNNDRPMMTEMAGFTKLFASLVTSTIWQEALPTKVVWVTMLALADRNGEVGASVPGLAAMAGVSLEECQEAIAKFMSPDKFSRTETEEGKRVEKIDGGWRLLNYLKYREMGRGLDRQEYLRGKQRESRARRSGQPVSTSVNLSQKQKTEAEAEGYPEGFLVFWKAYPRKTKKTDAAKAWGEAAPPLAAVLSALTWQVTSADWVKDNGAYVPYPGTYLRARRWEDEPMNVAPTRSQGHQATCGWHSSRFNGGKRAPRHAPTCPDCREWEAANRARDSRVETSEDVIKRLGLGDGS